MIAVLYFTGHLTENLHQNWRWINKDSSCLILFKAIMKAKNRHPTKIAEKHSIRNFMKFDQPRTLSETIQEIYLKFDVSLVFCLQHAGVCFG